MPEKINRRKTEHIRLCLNENVEGVNKTTGLEGISFIHNALPEIDFNDIQLETEFLGKQISAPFLVSSMTGGSDLAVKINQNLATAAEEKGWVMALGSTRALLESDAYKESFVLRDYAPSVPLIANLGAVQLNYGYGAEECQRIIEMTGADSIVLHFNSLQEAVQDEGDLNFTDLLPKIERLCTKLDVLVGAKEDPKGDYGRQSRQREVVLTTLTKVASFNSILNYQSVLNTMEDNVMTNLTFNDMVSMFLNYQSSLNNIEEIQLSGYGTRMDGVYYEIISEEDINEVSQQLKTELNINE